MSKRNPDPPNAELIKGLASVINTYYDMFNALLWTKNLLATSVRDGEHIKISVFQIAVVEDLIKKIFGEDVEG